MTDRTIEPGQRWAQQDRDGEYRYHTVVSVDGTTIVARGPRGRRTWKSGRFGRGHKFTFCGHDGPGILPPYSTHVLGCFNCGPPVELLPLEAWLGAGFGWTTVTRDGEVVWDTAYMSQKRVAHMELRARETPGDWRIRQQRPLRETLYQRQGEGRWVLVAIGMGFA